jgi:hypothetical protein
MVVKCPKCGRKWPQKEGELPEVCFWCEHGITLSRRHDGKEMGREEDPDV